MRVLIISLIMLAALLSSSVDAREEMDNVKPGPVTFNLEDGYKVSFSLDDSQEAYKIWSDARTSTAKGPAIFKGDWRASNWEKKYFLIIDGVMDIYIFKNPYGSPYIEPPKLGIDSSTNDDDYRITESKVIDGCPAFITYRGKWDNKSEKPDINSAESLEFMYFPGAIETPDGWKTSFLVHGYAYSSVLKKDFPLLNKIIETLHVSGPGIQT